MKFNPLTATRTPEKSPDKSRVVFYDEAGASITDGLLFVKDGKITLEISDPDQDYVLRRLVSFANFVDIYPIDTSRPEGT